MASKAGKAHNLANSFIVCTFFSIKLISQLQTNPYKIAEAVKHMAKKTSNTITITPCKNTRLGTRRTYSMIFQGE